MKPAVEPSKLGEVGCGAGEILKQLSAKLPSAVCHGYDISPQAIDMAGQGSDRLRFYCVDFLQTQEHYDLLLVMDVIEHIEDCFQFLRRLRGRADTYIFHIPLDMNVSMVLRNRVMDVRRSVGHIHYFSKATALATLEETGYEVIDSFYTPAYQIAKPDLVHRGMALLRGVSTRLAPDFTAVVLGGCPLLVLAR